MNDPEILEGMNRWNGNGLSVDKYHLIKKLDDNLVPKEEDDNCIVCCDKYDNQTNVAILPCGHIFHELCIKDWFKVSDICPLGRCKVDEKFDL